MDKLTTVLGCNAATLLNTLSVLLCSTNTGKTFHSAVHFPTETVISQMNREIELGSIKNLVALEEVTQSVSMLQNAVLSDKLSLGPDSQDTTMPNIEQLMSSKDELVSNFDNNDKKQRQIVEMVSGLSQESVLERPPLGSQVEQPQEKKKRGVPADNVLNDIQSPGCLIAKFATTFCSPTDSIKAIDNLVSLYVTSLSKLEQARHTLLTDIVQSQGQGVTGNLLAWSSLGSSERSLLGITSTLLNARKAAQTQEDGESGKDEPLQHVDNDMASIFSGFPSLLGSSMGQLSDTAGGMSSNMAQLAKPVNNEKRGGFMKQFFGK